MPFNYRKKQTTRKRSNLDLSVIKNALGDIDQGKSIRGVALEYGIDRNTLRNYLRDRSKLTKISEQGSQFKTFMIFTIEEEKALVEYLIACSKMNYGLTRQATMQLAYEYATMNSKKTRYNSAMNNWMISNPGRTVTIYNIPGFVNTIMSQAFSLSNILSGFRSTGIHPYNPDIFTDDDFLCSAVTDREMTSELQKQDVSSITSPSVAAKVPSDSTTVALPSTSTVRQSEPSTSASVFTNETAAPRINSPSILTAEESEQANTIPRRSAEIASTSNVLDMTTVDSDSGHTPKIVLPQTIRPFPKATSRKSLRRGRQPGKTKILTKTPEKLDQDDNQVTETDLEEEPKYDDSSDSPWDEVPDVTDNWFCFICGEDKVMDMRLCAVCGKYVHEMCVGLSKDDKEQFICPNCSN
ncbi:unnamed protein product [Acanthoscelides obtectus]|uniref:PHD-type domain-containing protein n=1 Tax=Acanthoscelides obtectus TaxID=200917 RepID=A0A9P0K7J8_ACAOB|nr:unnamed protein product [Acanthoscelides obtectus]CAK1631061.1 hypothetical protein AOBTE_LOCUS6735 [Acanthoscelides obtectus]